jgi:nicotinate phosphoribosyltransferase
LLDDADLPQVRIFVSGGLDEYDLERFRLDGVPVDAAGIGTHMGVSADAPSLDSAYKLVAYGDRPVLKLSAGKATLPGAKQVWRRSRIDEDILTTRRETGPAGFEPLLVPVMREGRRVGPPDTIEDARQRLVRDLDRLPGAAQDLHAPVAPEVAISALLRSLTDDATAAMRRRIGKAT